MPRLTAADRDDMPSSEFGLPGRRAYPMPDRSHAINAEARATQQERAGNLSPSSAAHIKAMARRKLGGAPDDSASANIRRDKATHPRQHALAMASATHLHKMGHIDGAHRDRIHATASAALAKARIPKMIDTQSEHNEIGMTPFGGFAPR